MKTLRLDKDFGNIGGVDFVGLRSRKLRGATMLKVVFGVLSIALMVLGSSATSASTDKFSEQLAICNDPNARPDALISACTFVAESGRVNDANLAIVLCARGIAYRAKGDIARAIQDYDRAIELSPTHADAYYNRGNAYRAKRDHDRAVLDYDQAIKLAPSYAPPYGNRGNAYRDKGQYDAAIKDFDQSIKLEPGDYRGFNNRCWTRFLMGKALEAGLADCTEALRLHPRHPDVLDNRSMIYFKLGRFDKTIADTTASLGAKAKSAPTLFIRGVAKRRNGDRDGGDADIAAAKALDPNVASEMATFGIAP